VEIVYEKEHGTFLAFDAIPEPLRSEILQRVRAREMRIEQFVTHDMLVEKISEQRRTPRRHMRVSFYAAVFLLVVAALAIGIADLFTRK
jgi:hypothetical protein